jgi:4-amino-4-deoxy-L-arabinose transferase-like glycosyltransferase
MLWAASINPELAAYRDEILFGQTVNRYVAADQHRQPFWYFIIAVIPVLWLPLTALLPWLLPRWREDFRQRDLRVLLPLAWTVIVVIFFSLSSGKRGVYVLPALPALVLACAPHLGELRQRIGAQRAMLGIACTVAAVTLITAGYGWVRTDQRQELIELYGLDVIGPLLAIGFAAAISCLVAGARRGWQAYGATLIVTLLVVSFWANPEMNEARSSAAFIRRVESMSAEAQLGLVAYREQYLLYLTRPTVNFGHSRWREGSQEAADAAAWLGAAPGRTLLVNQQLKDLCFTHAEAREAGVANRQTWFLVSGEANASCVGYGNAAAARTYGPGEEGTSDE